MSFDDALGYLNQWVLPPDTPGHQPRGEQASVGGPAPGSANLAAAAAAGKIPIPDLENLGIYAADVLGGYVVQGLEALMGPNTMGGLGYGASAYGKVGSAVRAGGLQGGAVLSVEEAERAMLESRREAEGLEKKLNNLVKRNKRMLAGGK
jgi:CCR4-NOT transcription complex subunit 4